MPRAWHTLLTYLSFHIPPASDFQPYDPLQQLTYAAVVLLLAPFMLLTGATMSPAIEARFPWYIKLFGGRQVGRSLHFLAMLTFVAFTILHTALVLIVRFQDNIRNIVLGSLDSSLTLSVTIAVLALLLVFLVYALTSWYSWGHKRRVQDGLGALVDPIRKGLLHRITSRQDYTQSATTDYFWVNGRPPVSEQFKHLHEHDFADWRLEVFGLVTNPVRLSLADLRKLPKQSQITLHNCIQGWSGIAEWTGVPLNELLKLCAPLPDAKYLVFTSYQHGKQSYPKGSQEAQESAFYEVLDMELARHPQTILAYEMNGQALPLEHGAPLRLRVETQLGYKMVKYLRSIEAVADYRHIGKGRGGFREDFQYYGRTAEI